MKTLLLILSCSIFLAIACSSKSSRTEYWIGEKDIPGIVFIDEQFGMDQTEITNFNWLEYMYWTGRVYGTDSQEYMNVLPDTTVWTKLDSAYVDLETDYLRHPSYRWHPVVGISYEQAKAFAEWRNDRVFEYLLIKHKFTTWERCLSRSEEEIVTIDRYKRGELDIPKSSKINRFPHYRIPSKQDWDRAKAYLDTQLLDMKKNKKEFLNKNCKGVMILGGRAIPDFVMPQKREKLDRWIFCLDNNLSELTTQSGTVIGSNWKGQVAIDEGSETQEITAPSALVGFRCAFEWK